ncbi:MAG TPA: hypothetical protein VEX35_07790 [Allosphingosinicella sp.]|nr:hypothetical protein [Allosphingosinicella sp.]
MRVLALLLMFLAAAPAAAQPRERVERTETTTVAFAGWERGDYLWANFVGTRGARFSAMVERDPIGQFLQAHRGSPVTVTIQTVRTTLPEAGRTTIRRVTGARNRAGTAQAWWRRLSPAQRRAAQRRFEQEAL